ncbi:2,3-bisphosphoglycerate-dependent phosphoglycerate mutase [Acidovorax sp. BoFeN1]|nr:2,3-bisphosphoglycerate-dependent phosphoglycerate mutase [Acidovorax sp. BoFeN1]
MANRCAMLVLLRHGSSLANEGQRFGGWDDVALSDRGVAQARAAGMLLQCMDLRFDISFTSVLRRAVGTLWHCLDALNQTWIPTVCDWRLNERHFGSLQGMTKSDAVARYGDSQVQRWRRGFNERPPPLSPGELRDSFGAPPYESLNRSQVPLCESLQDTHERVLACWDARILPALMRGENVLLVAHGNSIRALLMVLETIGEDEIGAVEVPNGIPLAYEFRTDERRFVRREIDGSPPCNSNLGRRLTAGVDGANTFPITHSQRT